MMEIVKLRNDGDLVEIAITVTGLIHWHFSYVARGREYTSHWDQPAPYEHPIGYGSEVKGRFHPWEFEIVNVGDEPQKYSLEIVWTQGDAELHRWSSGQQTLAARDGDILTNRAWVYLEEA